MNKHAILSLYIDSAAFDSHKQRWENDFICKENILVSVYKYFAATLNEKFMGEQVIHVIPCCTLCNGQYITC